MRESPAAAAALFLTLGLWTAGCGRTPAPAPVVAQAQGAAGVRAPCVHYSELQAFLPASLSGPLAGFRAAHEGGSTGRYGAVSVSEAERVYVGGEAGGEEERPSLSVRIVDTTLKERLAAAIQRAVEDGRARQADDPAAPLLLSQAVGFVRYDPEVREAEASLLVGGRFVVAVTGRGFDDSRAVREVARGLDTEGLARLR